MTTMRRFALTVSKVVQRFATPGSKEWAQATAGEIEHIESDWAALRWALGSMKILLTCHDREVPIASMADLPRAAQSLSETLRKRRLFGYAFVLIEGVWFGFLFRVFKFSVHQLVGAQDGLKMMRLGIALVMAAVLWIACEGILRSSRKMPRDGHFLARWYRSELERLRNFHSGALCWVRIIVLIPGPIVIWLGVWMIHRTAWQAVLCVSLTACFAFVVRSGVRNQPRLAATFQQRIDELDVLEKGQV